MGEDKTVLWTGLAGLAVAMVCCSAPALILFFGAAGLSAWLAGHAYILPAAFVLALAVTAFGLFLRHRHKGDN